MRTTDRQRFLALLSGIADYYGKELSNAAIGLYWQGLQQFEIADIERALWEHTQNPDAGQYMPKIADVTRTLHGRTQDQAALAWSKVDAAVRMVGTYCDVVFDDALIHRVIIELGGWIWLGKQDENEWPFIARRFENLYRGYCLRGFSQSHSLPNSPSYSPHLIGIANACNALEGRKAGEPLLLGDPAKAEAVRRGGHGSPHLVLHQASSFIVQDMALKMLASDAAPGCQPENQDSKSNKSNTKEAA